MAMSQTIRCGCTSSRICAAAATEPADVTCAFECVRIVAISSRVILRLRVREDRRDQLARVGLIVHDEDPEAVERRAGVIDGRGGREARAEGLRRRSRGDERQPDGERRAEAFPCALALDRPTMELDQMARDREAEAEAAVRPRGAAVGLAEPREE